MENWTNPSEAEHVWLKSGRSAEEDKRKRGFQKMAEKKFQMQVASRQGADPA